ncbi:hypothetical protein NDU88_003842 [Pleurodeles waltl]|uniref:Uncharacterized protein n=1 Tax=Pleurodeles waltl TaxID=8319 RepID=A0AAV7MEX2_PLEWA|nr:hypothetical protein NDU88_003842 [Pleurodeles waltl]
MTYDAEGVIKRKREDGRQERSEEKEEPRTRKSRGEETTTIQEPEEERENTGAGEQSTKREPTFTQELKGEEDTASNMQQIWAQSFYVESMMKVQTVAGNLVLETKMCTNRLMTYLISFPQQYKRNLV